jgi:erythromycin esterase
MHEFFRMKQRLLQYLVTVYGFQALALEASDDEVAPINEYLLTGRGEAAQAFSNLPPPWNSDEMLDVLYWMRGYNTAHLNAPLRLFGFDIQNPARAMDSVEKYLDQVDPAAAHLAAARYDCLRGATPE